MVTKTINDLKFEFLSNALGVSEGEVDDLEYQWLAAQVDVYATLTGYETNADLWHLYLEAIGYGTSYGTINDRKVAWLQGDFGYTGTIDDMLMQFYTDWEVAGWLLTDVEGNQIKDVDSNFILVLATS